MRELDIGVFLSSLGIPDRVQAVRKAHELGIKSIQVSGVSEYLAGEKRQQLIDVIKETGTNVSAICASYPGESYRDIQTVTDTVGLRPPAMREERIKLTLRIAELGRDLGAPILTCHIGVLPKDENSPLYQGMLQAVQEIADALSEKNMSFALETGQETAGEMKHFLELVARENVGVNFDPANMILYGTGKPIEAVEVLKDHILHVHVKDGTWPTEAGKLGTETRLGEGEVNIPAYVAKLKEIGYTGPLTIEREAGTTRIADIRASKKMLEEL